MSGPTDAQRVAAAILKECGPDLLQNLVEDCSAVGIGDLFAGVALGVSELKVCLMAAEDEVRWLRRQLARDGAVLSAPTCREAA